MKFPYLYLPGDPQKTLRPLVRTKLKHRDRVTPDINFLVDSGADYSYADTNIAAWLGIDLSTIEPISSLAVNNTKFRSFPHDTTIIIGGHELEIPMLFAENLGYNAILGQEVIFDKFRVVFERYKEQFQLIPKF